MSATAAAGAIVHDAAAAGAHLAHEPEWAAIIHRAYGHAPLYLTAGDADGRTGVLPAFVVRRPFGGTIVSSMPYLDGGGPYGSSPALSRHLVERLVEAAHGAGAGSVEIRSAEPLDVECAPLDHKVNMVLDLGAGPDRLWNGFDRTVRNQVRKAERAGLVVERGGPGELDEFYAVYAARMQDLGSPPHSRAFFRATLDGFGDRARLVLIRKGRLAVGGLIALTHRDTMTVPWASCRQEHFALCPNMLLYWDTIRAASGAGLARFDFGRSTRGSGTHRFKRQWGAAERALYWYTVPLRDTVRPSSTSGGRQQARLAALWRRLPASLTRRVGPHLRKYLVQ